MLFLIPNRHCRQNFFPVFVWRVFFWCSKACMQADLWLCCPPTPETFCDYSIFIVFVQNVSCAKLNWASIVVQSVSCVNLNSLSNCSIRVVCQMRVGPNGFPTFHSSRLSKNLLFHERQVLIRSSEYFHIPPAIYTYSEQSVKAEKIETWFPSAGSYLLPPCRSPVCRCIWKVTRFVPNKVRKMTKIIHLAVTSVGLNCRTMHLAVRLLNKTGNPYRVRKGKRLVRNWRIFFSPRSCR